MLLSQAAKVRQMHVFLASNDALHPALIGNTDRQNIQ